MMNAHPKSPPTKAAPGVGRLIGQPLPGEVLAALAEMPELINADCARWKKIECSCRWQAWKHRVLVALRNYRTGGEAVQLLELLVGRLLSEENRQWIE